MWTVHKGGVLCTPFSNCHINLLYKLKMRTKHQNNSSSLIKKLKIKRKIGRKIRIMQGGTTSHDEGSTTPKGFTFHL
jgi:hypothetical protein